MPDEESNINESLGRLLGVLARRRWWILLPACGVTLAGIAIIITLPNHYTSEATLLVVRQQVPERYVVPNSTTDVYTVLQALKQEVLSRTRLTKIIDQFGLYQKPNKLLPPESLVDRMLRDTDIEPVMENPTRKDFDAFKISFVADSPVLAQAVASNLTSLFINENLRTRNEQATNTTNFLREQVAAKAKRLEDQEQLLRDFKMQHIGELPEQQSGNLGILSGLESQLQNTNASLGRAQEQRVYLESLLSSYKRQAALTRMTMETNMGVPMPGTPNVGRNLTPIEMAQSEVARLQSAKAALLSRSYTAEHPDVVKNERELARAEDALRRLRAAAPPPPKEEQTATVSKTARPSAPSDTSEDPAAAQISSQLEAKRLEIDNLAKDEKRLKAAIEGYQNRLNQTPIREQQESGIMREAEALRQEYTELQKREQESQLATNLEKQQGGQQFRLVDPPSLPSMPSSPNRLKLSFGACGAGLFLGFGIALILEMMDTSFRSQKELSRHFTPPFVIDVPVLFLPGEENRRAVRAWFEWLAGSALVSLTLIAEFYVFRKG